MSRTIWKYEIEITDRQVLKMPTKARLLPFVAQQPGQPSNMLCLWAEVDLRNSEAYPMEKVPIYVVGTGNPMPEEVGNDGYLGSVQSGVFVWHVYRGMW